MANPGGDLDQYISEIQHLNRAPNAMERALQIQKASREKVAARMARPWNADDHFAYVKKIYGDAMKERASRLGISPASNPAAGDVEISNGYTRVKEDLWTEVKIFLGAIRICFKCEQAGRYFIKIMSPNEFRRVDVDLKKGTEPLIINVEDFFEDGMSRVDLLITRAN